MRAEIERAAPAVVLSISHSGRRVIARHFLRRRYRSVS
jgi:hypothetical protein